MPDNDVVEIDAASLAINRSFAGVGTSNFDIAVHPTTGTLYVVNTDARNLVRFEPAVRGHAIDSRVTTITTGATPVITPIDLNPGINYATLPNAAARTTALSEATSIVLDSAAGHPLRRCGGHGPRRRAHDRRGRTRPDRDLDGNRQHRQLGREEGSARPGAAPVGAAPLRPQPARRPRSR